LIKRAATAVRDRFKQLWDDLTSSTDAGLLGVVRFFGLLYGPIDRSLPIDEAFKKALRYRLAPHVGWRHMFGGICYLLFMVLVVTGVLLALHYRPSIDEAYPSIQHIVSEVSFGWLIRDVHMWAANLLVIAVLAHMARVFFLAAYKPPRETNWLIGLLLLIVVLAFGSTGYLLPWDQWAYWTVTEVVDAIRAAPLIGHALADALAGDEIVSGATLSRSFSLHVIVLPWIAFALLMYHFTLVRRRGIAPPPDEPEVAANWRLSTAWSADEMLEEEGTPFFPNHMLRLLIVTVFVLAVLTTLAALFPKPIGSLADPYTVPDSLVSTWVPVDVSLALIRFLGSWGFTLFTLLAVVLALLPLFDRSPERRPRQRPVATTLGLIFFLAFLASWLVGRRIRSIPPSARPQPQLIGELPGTGAAPPGSILSAHTTLLTDGVGEPNKRQP
jgi:quinol-cytochrome oxidoreductase complex cytochrome b subunit